MLVAAALSRDEAGASFPAPPPDRAGRVAGLAWALYVSLDMRTLVRNALRGAVEGGTVSVNERRSARYEVDGEVCLRVLFTRSNDIQEVKARVRNVGPGGLFVETTEPIDPGALTDLDLRLTGHPLANTMGIVKWIKPGEGAGIEFFYGTDEEKEALERYLLDWLARKKGKRGRPEPSAS